MGQLVLPLGSNPRHTFANFCAEAESPAPAALERLLRHGGLVWLHGGAGSGKSHLLQACAYRMRDRGESAAYLPLARQRALGPGALERLERMPFIGLDDLDAVLGRPEWERQLFALINQVRDRDAALLLASRAGPAEAKVEFPDLRSRLRGAGAFALAPLREERQREALRLRARSQGYELPDDVMQYLRTRARRDLGALCALLDRLEQQAHRRRRRITVPLAREVLAAD